MVLSLVSSVSPVWLSFNYNHFPAALGVSVPSADATVILVVICWLPGQDWGRAAWYKPSIGTGYLKELLAGNPYDTAWYLKSFVSESFLLLWVLFRRQNMQPFLVSSDHFPGSPKQKQNKQGEFGSEVIRTKFRVWVPG